MHCGQILASLVSFLDHLVYTGIHMLQIFINRAAVALAAAVVFLNLSFIQVIYTQTHIQKALERDMQPGSLMKGSERESSSLFRVCWSNRSLCA